MRVAIFRRHLPLVVAQARGLDCELRIVRSSGEQRTLVEAGEAELAHTAIDNVAAWHSEEHEWAVLRVVDLGLPHQLVARPPLETLADVRGRRIGVDSARAGFVTLLRRILPDAEGVEFVEVGALRQRLEALERGEVDACLLGAEQLRAALAMGARPLTTLNEHFPAYPGLTVTGIAGAVPAGAAAYAEALSAAAAWCFAPERRDEVLALVDVEEPEAWYAAELARWSGTVNGDERAVLERAWRATGRLAPDQPAPAGWYRPELAARSASAS